MSSFEDFFLKTIKGKSYFNRLFQFKTNVKNVINFFFDINDSWSSNKRLFHNEKH